MQRCMNILPIVAPHTEVLILEAATKKRVLRIWEQLFRKVSQNVS